MTFVVGALVVLAISRLVPVSAVQLYLQGAAGIVALWPAGIRDVEASGGGAIRGTAATNACCLMALATCE